ncbi:MAG: GAF domain-containing SpoIIE family protein phosphatase [Verrucomicrobiota bacterium]
MELFLVGLGSGCLFALWVLFREKRKNSDLIEKAAQVQQEKLIVVDFMHNMVEALGEGLSKEELYQRIVHASIVSTGALSACVFELTDRRTLKGVAVEGLFPPHRPLPESSRVKLTTRAKFIERILKSEEFPMGDGVVGSVAASKTAVLIEDGRKDPRIVKHDDPALVVSTAICAPIMFRDRLIGVLAVTNSADGLPFSKTDFSLVQSIAEQAGMAVHNNEFLSLQVEKKQIDVDLMVARNIQMMLVPQEWPDIRGVDMDARYVSSQQVGGDLYDIIDLGESRFALAVADVSGKGIPASIIMAICRTNLRHYANKGESPAEVLKNVNRAMAGEMREGMYITMLYAILDVGEGMITYSRAGHEQALLCRLDEERKVHVVDSLDCEGMPVGLVDADLFDEVIEERKVPFREGDLFVAYTDGLTETTNPEGKEFSASRLADVIKTLRKRSSEDLNDGVLESVERFSGKPDYGDDLTLVTVKRI